MKTKIGISKIVTVIGSVLLVCLILYGCGDQKAEEIVSEDPVSYQTGTQRNLEEENILNLCRDLYKDGQSVIRIVQSLGDAGYIAVDSENLVNMTCHDMMKNFIRKKDSGDSAEVTVVRVSEYGGFSLYDIFADDGKAFIHQKYYQYMDGQLTETLSCEFDPVFFEYTDEGYLIFEGHYDFPETYVLTLREEEEHTALRIDPLDEKCREMCDRIIKPVSYGLNNLFITEWNWEDYGDVDFYDVFELFYSDTYQSDFPYPCNEDLSVGNEYNIPAEEFENVITRHFEITKQELRSRLRYDENTDTYLFRPRGFGEYDYAQIPSPEVVSYRENTDGTITLLVNAVFPIENTSRLFSHEVTVKEEDGSIFYLSNHILDENEPDLWWHADRFSDDEWNENYKSAANDDEDDYSWMLPKVSHELFLEEEKKQIEEDVLTVASGIWDLYENVEMDDNLPSYSSGIVGFTKEERALVVKALGSQGVAAVSDDINTQNGEQIKHFYDDYLNGETGMVTVYNVQEDGLIAAVTFLYRDEEIQTYYVGVKPGTDRGPVISGKSVQEIAAINYTKKGYFIYEDKNPMLHASAFGFFRVSPLPDECRKLTDRFLKHLDFQKYKLMVCDWNEETAASMLMPGMFEDFYYIKYHEGYRGSFEAIPGELFEEILTTYLPVTEADLRAAYTYDEKTKTYSQKTVYNSPYPPFLEVTDYDHNADGTITLYADGVWPDYNSDLAFSNVIVVRPFDDGTFRILSNDVEEKELKLPPVAYSGLSVSNNIKGVIRVHDFRNS